MRRHLLNGLTVVSLVLMVAVCALWVRSYFVQDVCSYARAETFVAVQLLRGVVLIQQGHVVTGAGFDSAGTVGFRHGTRRPPAALLLHGVGWHATDLASRRYHVLWFPLWLPAVLACALPAGRFVTMERERRRSLASRKLCTTCGYDLRATPERCPECGTVVAVASR